jgi:hypothetical protein
MWSVQFNTLMIIKFFVHKSHMISLISHDDGSTPCSVKPHYHQFIPTWSSLSLFIIKSRANSYDTFQFIYFQNWFFLAPDNQSSAHSKTHTHTRGHLRKSLWFILYFRNILHWLFNWMRHQTHHNDATKTISTFAHNPLKINMMANMTS